MASNLRIDAAELLLFALALLLTKTTTSFILIPPPTLRSASPFRHRQSHCCYYQKNDNNDDRLGDSFFDMDVLQDRLMHMRVSVLEEELRQPPHPDLSAKAFVHALLSALWDNSNPLPDSGFRTLLRSSTPQWRRALCDSVGAPPTFLGNSAQEEEVVASALGEAMARPHNQFAILVNDNNNDDNKNERRSLDTNDSNSIHHPGFVIEFPSEVLDYGDGTCWVEVRLRSRKNRSLYVVMGWELQQRATDGAWLVGHLDWQDFRDEFRPGIGREEWMRICG